MKAVKIVAIVVLGYVGIVVAFDKTSGKVRWQTKKFQHGYGSPVAFTQKGKSLVAVHAWLALVGLRASALRATLQGSSAPFTA